MTLIELADRCEKARDIGEMDALCRELHEIDEHSNVNGSCAAYVYNLQDAKRLIPAGHCYVMACDVNRVWVKVTNTATDAVSGYSVILPGTFAETRALCAAALRAIAAATGTAKTPRAVECEASQSGPKGIAR